MNSTESAQSFRIDVDGSPGLTLSRPLTQPVTINIYTEKQKEEKPSSIWITAYYIAELVAQSFLFVKTKMVQEYVAPDCQWETWPFTFLLCEEDRSRSEYSVSWGYCYGAIGGVLVKCLSTDSLKPLTDFSHIGSHLQKEAESFAKSPFLSKLAQLSWKFGQIALFRSTKIWGQYRDIVEGAFVAYNGMKTVGGITGRDFSQIFPHYKSYLTL